MSRITPGTVIVGIFAILFGLVGAYGVRKYLQSDNTVAPPAAPALQTVPLASMDLEPGRTIVLGEVALLQLTQAQIASMQKSGKLPPQYMSNPQQIIGRILRNPLKQGDAFKTDDLYAEGTGPTIAEKLAPGLRAVTIPVDGTGALGGYDGPGSFVDILFRTQPDEKAGIPETTVTLLEGVQVLAMEEAGKRNPPGVKLENRVTLAVTADQANALKIAEGRGTFALSLRNPDDVEIAASSVPQTLDRLLNLPVQNQHVTAIFRGGSQPQSASFPGQTITSQPAVALPVAGVLQLRAAQQATSVEAAEGDPSEESDPAASEVPSAAPESGKTAPRERPAAPGKASPPTISTRMGDAAVAVQAKPADIQDTVTVQIPVSVLLGATRQGAGLGIVSGAPSGTVPPAPSVPIASVQTDPLVGPNAADSASAVLSSSRPRKMLSDIGRDYWDRTPKYRSRN